MQLCCVTLNMHSDIWWYLKLLAAGQDFGHRPATLCRFYSVSLTCAVKVREACIYYIYNSLCSGVLQ